MTHKDEEFSKERKEALDKIDKVYETEHEHNKKKLKYGIYCLFGIPMVFLVLLFTMNSSKLVFLVLWIASLFIISGYLVAVEYSDFRLQENFADILNKHKEMESLLDVPDITDIDLSRFDKPILSSIQLPQLPRLELYRKEKERREQADANVEMLMKQVAELTAKINKLEGNDEPLIEEKHDDVSKSDDGISDKVIDDIVEALDKQADAEIAAARETRNS